MHTSSKAYLLASSSALSILGSPELFDGIETRPFFKGPFGLEFLCVRVTTLKQAAELFQDYILFSDKTTVVTQGVTGKYPKDVIPAYALSVLETAKQGRACPRALKVLSDSLKGQHAVIYHDSVFVMLKRSGSGFSVSNVLHNGAVYSRPEDQHVSEQIIFSATVDSELRFHFLLESDSNNGKGEYLLFQKDIADRLIELVKATRVFDPKINIMADIEWDEE